MKNKQFFTNEANETKYHWPTNYYYKQKPYKPKPPTALEKLDQLVDDVCRLAR